MVMQCVSKLLTFSDLDKVDKAIKQIKAAMLAWESAETKRLATERLEAERVAKEQAEKEKIEEAIRLEAMGEKAAAEAVINEPLRIVPPPVMESNAPKMDGISTRMTTKHRIVNEKLIPREYLIPDEKKIGLVVKAMGLETKIPGIEVYEEPTMSVRGAA